MANSKYARRITGETEMRISGPAAGHDRMKTGADPSGSKVLGMLNNCAGGRTPWGTWLTCEENINGYFSGELGADHAEARNYRRMGIPGRWYNWGDYFDRFNLAKEPNEANRFGWAVEIDPFDPASTPVKRTALGRFKREGAAGILNKDGRYVIYSGDDQRFEYVYKFVTEGRFDPGNRAANMNLLDTGTAYVAKFNADGTGEWLALVHGQGPLTDANGFKSQADVVIEARTAADLLGATKMDRPEDVEANPKTNKVYVMLTNNSRPQGGSGRCSQPARRQPVSATSSRSSPTGDDHAAVKFRWEILVKCGDPVDCCGRRDIQSEHVQGWLVRHAGQLRRRTRWAGSGYPPTAITPSARGAPTGSGQWRRRVRPAQPRSCFFAVPTGRRCADPSSHLTTPPCSWPCSTRVRPTKATLMPRLQSSKAR